MRGTSFIVLLAALLLGEAGPARADYPDRPVRVIVPFIAGAVLLALLGWASQALAAIPAVAGWVAVGYRMAGGAS